jgi:serine/threonine protein kinase
MPPQSQAATATPERRTEEVAGKSRNGTSKSGRSSNRQLGDYTLSKSLGAGSMGKVKLAHHNLTGHKVCISFLWALQTLIRLSTR